MFVLTHIDRKERRVTSTTNAGLKVLVVEDNTINQRLAVGMLQSLGHTGVVVGDGEKALMAMGKLKFDVVLMDVMMPVMDGMEALKELRVREATQGGHMPVIMATAHTEPEERTRFRKAGADGFVAKPIELEALRTELARVMGRN
ncbi:response regulator [Curvibacter sp. APW13]|uniref:response regulator n=1 Tax=Curvibacter sp. APW13 TaxID=3077236 RepID=UPI0028E009F7|nr:response regulator [Curvibacter sp. APW13]MDT8991866.1 response regulator [Curvibacter sp. APW13]